MSEVQTLSVALRERAGKGAARQSRRDGFVPGVIYGAKQDPLLINIAPNVLMKELRNPGFYTRVYDLKVGDRSEHVLPRDVQFDPVSDKPLHVDFLRVSDSATIHVMVPVHFFNDEEAPGIKRGGVLNVVRHEIGFVCRVDAIPHSLEVDLSGREIGDTIHISEIPLPAGATLEITDRDFTVATIAAPSVVKAEIAEEQEAIEQAKAEPEEETEETEGEGEAEAGSESEGESEKKED